MNKVKYALLKFIKKQFKRKIFREIMSKRNVNGIGIGFKNGDPAQGLCFIVSVEKKLQEHMLLKKDLVPKRFLFFKTDVFMAGELTAISSWKERHRPIRIGASACWEGLTACSVGLPLWGADGTPYLLMNQHCINPVGSKPGDAVLQPSPADGGTKKDKIGEVTDYFFPVHSVIPHNIDVSLARLTEDVYREDVEGTKYFPHVRDLGPGDVMQYITGGGRTLGTIRQGISLAVDFLAGVWGVENGKRVVRYFDDCVFALNSDKDGNPIVLGGDSSSIRFMHGRPLLQTFAGCEVSAVFNQTSKSIKWLEDTFGLKLSLNPPDQKLEGYIALEGRWSNGTITSVNGLRVRISPGMSSILRTLKKGDKITLLDEKPVYKDGYYWGKVVV